MNAPQVNLIVVRSIEPSRSVEFYKMLGMEFQEEQHGSGPAHWAPDIDGIVLEVYPVNLMS